MADNTILIKIVSKLDAKGLEDAKEKTEEVGKKAGEAAGQVSAGKEIMIGAFRAVGEAAVAGIGMAVQAMVGFGQQSVSMAMNFQQQMSGVQAVLGGTAEDNQMLTDLALELGAKTSYSAQEAAEGLEILAANGLTAQQILDGAAQATLDLAAATGGDLQTAASTMTDTMSVFGISAKDAGQAINGITGVTIASKYDINDYALALAQGGAIAASSGVSFEDFNTSIAVLAPLFSSGSDAGTSFKTMLQRLVPASGPAADAMYEVGLLAEDGTSKFYDANGQLKDMAEVAQIMQDAFGGLSEAQRTQTMSTIFGSDAMRAAIGFMRSGGDAFETTAEKIDEVSAADQAAIRLDNFAGAMEALNGAMDTLKITLGTLLLPMLQTLVEDYLAPLVEAVQSAVNAFKDGEDPVLAFAAALAKAGWANVGTQILILRRHIVNTFNWLVENKEGIIASVTAIATVFTVAAIPAIIASLQAMAVAAWAAVAPLLPLYAVAALVGGIAFVIAENWDTLVATFNAAGGGIAGFGAAFVQALGFIWDALDSLLGPVDEWVAEMAMKFGAWVGEAWTNMSNALGEWWGQFTHWLDRQPSLISFHMERWWAAMTEWVRLLWVQMRIDLQTWWMDFSGWIEQQKANIAEAVKGWIDGFTGWVGGIWSGMTTKLNTWWGQFTDWINSRPEAMKEGVAAIGKSMMDGIIGGVTSKAQALIDAVGNAIKGSLNLAKNLIDARSPSRVFRDQVGKMMGLGIVEGIMDTTPQIRLAGGMAAASGLVGAQSVMNVTNNYTYSPTYGGMPNIAGDAALVRSLAGAQ